MVIAGCVQHEELCFEVTAFDEAGDLVRALYDGREDDCAILVLVLAQPELDRILKRIYKTIFLFFILLMLKIKKRYSLSHL
jgi:hypothetical protein